MSWGAEESQCVPPLASWVFYLVNPGTSRNFNAIAFILNLESGIDLYSASGSRYEFFLLPGVTPEQCVAHYRGEIATRGTMWRQVRHVRMATKERKGEDKEGADNSAEKSSSDGDNNETQPGITNEQGLPVLPWPKHDEDWFFTNYRQFLFMYLDANSDIQSSPDQGHNVCLVQFDPMPMEREEGEVVRWDPMEHPIYTKCMKLIDEKGSEGDLRDWKQDIKNDRWALEASNATDNAKKET